MTITVTDIVSVVGLVTGVSGFILGIFNYLRDQHKIEVSLQWDLMVTQDPHYDSSKLWGLVRVTNIGRRPTYISHVALRISEGKSFSYLVLMDGLQGKKLSEGDPSAAFPIEQDIMRKHADKWDKIVAQVSDSSGKEWFSKKQKNKPKWAK